MNDTMTKPTGHVKGYWEDQDGKRTPAFDIHNTIMYAASDVMAKLYGGGTVAPDGIGFIIGTTNAAPALPSGKNVSLASVRGVSGVTEVAVLPFSYLPTVTASSSDYDIAGLSGNVVSFHGRSEIDSSSATYIYGAVLLANSVYTTTGEAGSGIVVGMISFDPVQKPAGLQLALDWSVTFTS